MRQNIKYQGGLMKLIDAQVTDYKCIDDSNLVAIDQVTCLVGKNESGKTTFLEALAKLNPIEGKGTFIDLDYPRKRMRDYRAKKAAGEKVLAVRATFEMSKDEIEEINEEFGVGVFTKPTFTVPIYIGKAVPSGWRQGRLSTEATAGRELYRRIKEHAKNIDGSENLDAKDFEVRFMVFRDDTVNLISTIESALIRKYNPLWNSIIDGFGNHDPGKGRYNQAVSEWDFLHPGRIWVARLTGQKPEMEQIISKIRKYIEGLDG